MCEIFQMRSYMRTVLQVPSFNVTGSIESNDLFYLSHNLQQSDLTNINAFSTHIWSGDYGHITIDGRKLQHDQRM